MTTATATGFQAGARAKPRAGTIQRYAIATWAFAFAVMSFGLWAVLRDDDTPSAYYIVKRIDSGRCTVTHAPPEGGEFKTLWFSTVQQSALKKVHEFKEQRRCG